jgi:hypothetical protein
MLPVPAAPATACLDDGTAFGGKDETDLHGATLLLRLEIKAGSLEGRRGLVMKKVGILCIMLWVGFSPAAFARGGGMGGHHASRSGGASGTSPTAPGTNSDGTALSSSEGAAGAKEKGPALGTGDPAVDAEDQRVVKMLHSICTGC